MPVLLADAAPTGAGLAIIAVILLALFIVFVALVVFAVVKVRRFLRRRRASSDPEALPS